MTICTECQRTTNQACGRHSLVFQAYAETKRDRLRCHLCRRWTRKWVVQGLVDHPDPDAVSRKLCDRCAKAMREGDTE